MVGTNETETQALGGQTASTQAAIIPTTDLRPAPASTDPSMHRGWFKVWRKWADHELAADANAWLIMTHILCETRRAPKENRRYGYVLQRGQCDLTMLQLEERTGLSRKAVRLALDRMERYGTIKRGTQVGRQPAITTVVNYDLYNPDASDNGTQEGTQREPQGATQRAIEGATPLEVKTGKTVETVKNNYADEPPGGFDFRADFLDHYPKFGNGRNKVQDAERLYLGLPDKAAVKKAVVAFRLCADKWAGTDRTFLQSPYTWLDTEREHGFRIRTEEWARQPTDAGRNPGVSRAFSTRAEQGDKFAGLGT